MRDDLSRPESGTALLELLTGASIAMVVLTSLMMTMASQTRLRRVSEEQNFAMVACRNNLETIRDLPFASILAVNNTGFDVPDFGGTAGALRAVPGDSDGLPGQILVTVDQTSAGETIYLVRMVVLWQGISGRQRFEMKSLVADRKGN